MSQRIPSPQLREKSPAPWSVCDVGVAVHFAIAEVVELYLNDPGKRCPEKGGRNRFDV
jgi:hypothetical protein